MVVEKLEIDKHKFWIDSNSQLNYTHQDIEGEGSIVFTKEETIDLLNGLGRQLDKAESNKPLFTWPWTTVKKH